MIRILIADDHPVVRDGLLAILSTQPDFNVIADVGTGREAVEQTVSQMPDVVLLDLEMPEMDGVETLRVVRQRVPKVQVLVFTAFDTDERIFDAIRAGAQGYLLKGSPRQELFRAIRVVANGGSLLQEPIASRLMQQMREPQPQLYEPLTARESEVLQLLARGLQNKEISAELHITERTVKFHVSSILGKLSAGNRTEAVTKAMQHNLIRL